MYSELFYEPKCLWNSLKESWNTKIWRNKIHLFCYFVCEAGVERFIMPYQTVVCQCLELECGLAHLKPSALLVFRTHEQNFLSCRSVDWAKRKRLTERLRWTTLVHHTGKDWSWSVGGCVSCMTIRVYKLKFLPIHCFYCYFKIFSFEGNLAPAGQFVSVLDKNEVCPPDFSFTAFVSFSSALFCLTTCKSHMWPSILR